LGVDAVAELRRIVDAAGIDYRDLGNTVDDQAEIHRARTDDDDACPLVLVDRIQPEADPEIDHGDHATPEVDHAANSVRHPRYARDRQQPDDLLYGSDVDAVLRRTDRKEQPFRAARGYGRRSGWQRLRCDCR